MPGTKDTYCMRPPSGSKGVFTHTLVSAPLCTVKTAPSTSVPGWGYRNLGFQCWPAQQRSPSGPKRGAARLKGARITKWKLLVTWAGTDADCAICWFVMEMITERNSHPAPFICAPSTDDYLMHVESSRRCF